MSQLRQPLDSYALMNEHFERARTGASRAQQVVDFQLADTYLRESVEAALQWAAPEDIAAGLLDSLDSTAERMRAEFTRFVARTGPVDGMSHAFDLDWAMTSDGWQHMIEPARPQIEPIDIRDLRAFHRPDLEQVSPERHAELERENAKWMRISAWRQAKSEREMVDLQYAPDEPGDDLSL
jgi:hypothetical protein